MIAKKLVRNLQSLGTVNSGKINKIITHFAPDSGMEQFYRNEVRYCH